MKSRTLAFVTVAILLTVTIVLARRPPEASPARASLSSLPTQLGDWKGADLQIDQQTLDVLGNGEFLSRGYIQGPNEPYIEVFIAYFASQKAGDTIHSPSHCLPGAGWIPTQRIVVQLPKPDGSTFPANRYVVTKGGERQLVLYWYQAHGREVASEYLSKYYLVADAIRMNRSDGSLVRVMTPMYRGESADAAQARVWDYVVNKLIPILDTYIPR